MIKVNIVGSGIGGLATAVRLAKAGHDVTVFEGNNYPGGKLCELRLGNYRFDKGPSLFTMPELINELSVLCNDDRGLEYVRLKDICNYFYEDGVVVHAKSGNELFAGEVAEKLGENKEDVLNHLNHSSELFYYTADLFLHKSLHKASSFLNRKAFSAFMNLKKLKLSKTMHQVNTERFKNPKTVQIFNRYATYVGSNPYKAPALLNIIPHLEYNMGAYMPKAGMNAITNYVYQLAKAHGVKFLFEHKVEEIVVKQNKTTGVIAKGTFYPGDIVISNSDVNLTYEKLLKSHFTPKRILNQEKSSSAFIFYWGIKKQFNELNLNNIFFTENYKEEFDQLFEGDKPYHDPTIYIHVSSKVCKTDAPEGSENWFVLINAPHNKSRGPITYYSELRKNVIAKLSRILKADIEPLIEAEETIDPYQLEVVTSSYGGSLYGNASNSKFSAFLRHSNFSSKIKGLYFCGGSVHPGGGIPLCLLSAKIASDLILKKYN